MLLGKHRTDPPTALPPDERKLLAAPITILKTDRNGGPKTFFGYAKDISRSGMLIGATRPKEPGSRFLLEIPLPPPIDKVAICECEVVWKRDWSKQTCSEPGMGLRFVDLPDDIAAAIDTWVAKDLLREQLSA
jgi:hypothetical protein